MRNRAAASLGIVPRLKMPDRFDYVMLENGDLLYVTDAHVESCSGLVTYTSHHGASTGSDRLFGSSLYRRLFATHFREEHDAYVQNHYREALVSDCAGLRVRVDSSASRETYSARQGLEPILETSNNIPELLDRLGVDASVCGVTGSSLLSGRVGTDLDLVVYGTREGALVSRRIPTMRRLGHIEPLPSPWSRPYHHRRFLWRGIEICPRFPLASSLLAEILTAGAWPSNQPWPQDGGTKARVLDSELGHCSPAVYTVGFEEPPLGIPEIPLVSFDIRHSMAFSTGDMLSVHEAELWSGRNGPILVVKAGKANGILPP